MKVMHDCNLQLFSHEQHEENRMQVKLQLLGESEHDDFCLFLNCDFIVEYLKNCTFQ